MPYRLTYDRSSADLRFHGETTGREILESKHELFAHRFDEEPPYAVCDFTAVRKFDVSVADVKAVAEQDRRAAIRNPGLVEVVVAPTPLEYGSARMWELLVDDVRERTRVGKTRAEVLQWLADNGVELSPEHQRELTASRARQA